MKLPSNVYLVGQWVYLESVQPGDELVRRAFGPVLGVNHEKHVREASPEVGAIGVVMPEKSKEIVGCVGQLMWGRKNDVSPA